jgi:hypothetical protein
MVTHHFREVISERINIQCISKNWFSPKVTTGTAVKWSNATPENGMRPVDAVHLYAIGEEARNRGVDRPVKVAAIARIDIDTISRVRKLDFVDGRIGKGRC